MNQIPIAHPSFGPSMITLRPVNPDDDDFLWKVFACTRVNELTHLPWDEAQKEAFLTMQFQAQRQHYQSRFPQGVHQIILLNEQPVGRTYVAKTHEEIRILDITILPEHRCAGIGTHLLKCIQAQATEAQQPVRIHVESNNPSLRLFDRLGFSQLDEDGFNLLLEWRPRISSR